MCCNGCSESIRGSCRWAPRRTGGSGGRTFHPPGCLCLGSSRPSSVSVIFSIDGSLNSVKEGSCFWRVCGRSPLPLFWFFYFSPICTTRSNFRNRITLPCWLIRPGACRSKIDTAKMKPVSDCGNLPNSRGIRPLNPPMSCHDFLCSIGS